MQVMKKATMLALLLVLLPGVLSAQGRRGEGRGRMEMQGRMGMGMMGEHGNPARALIERREEIGLNDEQVTRLEELAKTMDETREAMRASMQAMRDSGVARRGMSEEHRAAMQAWRGRMGEAARTMNEGIRSTLTDEQWQKVGPRKRGQARDQARRRRGGGPGGPGMVAPRAPRVPRSPGIALRPVPPVRRFAPLVPRDALRLRMRRWM